jgi:oligopeptide transport system permease protein
MKQLLQGDLGPSYKYIGRDVSDILRDTFPVSFTLGMCAVLVVLGLGVPAGVISAYWKNSLLDRSILLFAAMGISVPSFVLGAISVWIFSHQWHLLPPALWEGPRYMILPAFALGTGFAGYIARLTRTTVLDVLGSDYIRTARAKGLTEFSILLRHVLKNSMYPIVSVMGPLTAGLITGSFVIEFIFSIPGMGRFFITAVTNRDYPLIMGVTLVYAVLIVVATIVGDMIYGWLDPRVSVK